jgi:hypothetical protein
VSRHYLVPWWDVDWEYLYEVMEDIGAAVVDPEEGVVEAWRLGDTGIHLFVEGVQQLAVDGDDADRVARLLRDRIRTYGPADMPAVFDDPIYGWDGRLAILAAVAPPAADPVLLDLFRRGLGHDDPHVRATAALSAAIPRWPELRPDIERLATTDPEERVRQAAMVVLGEMDKPPTG